MPSTKAAVITAAATAGGFALYKVYRYYALKRGFASWFRTLPLILVVDIGSSSIRCSAYAIPAQEWIQVAGSMQQCRQNALNQDAVTILERVNHVVDDCMRFLRANQLASQVIAVGFSSFVMNLVGTNKDGEIVTPVYTYADQHIENSTYAEKIRRTLVSSDQVCDRTGVPIHSSYAPAQLFRVAKTQPEVLANVYLWQTLVSIVLAAWTGQIHQPISYSEASWTGLFDFRHLQWDQKLAKMVGISLHTLPRVVDSIDYISGLGAVFARRWPELTHAKLFYGIGDGAAANIGSKCTDPSRIAVTIGTSAAMRVILPLQRVESSRIPRGLWCYRISKASVLMGGALTDGGSIYKWINDVFQVNPDTFQKASQLPPTSHGLTFLPFLNGERAPGWSDVAKCCIAGISATTLPHHVLRAGIESVALRLSSIQSLMASYFARDSLVIASGTALTSSTLWRQILADCLAKDVCMEYEAKEATSKGVAILIGSVLSEIGSGTTQLGACDIANPNPRAHAVYLKAKHNQEDLYEKVIPKLLR